MTLRHKKTGASCSGSQFNIHALNEIIVYFDDGDANSDYPREYDVLLSSGEWKDLQQAMKDHDVIHDNYNTWFFEPQTPEDRERGYTL